MPWKTGKPHDSDKAIGRHVDIYKTDSTGKRAKDFKHHQDIKVSYDEDKPFVRDINPSGEKIRESRFVVPGQIPNLKPTEQGREELTRYMELVRRYDATLDEIRRLYSEGLDTQGQIRGAKSLADAILQIGKQIALQYPTIFLSIRGGNVPVAEFARACKQAHGARIRELAQISPEASIPSRNRPSIRELRKNWVDFVVRNNVGIIKDE
jgi:hypothetical protein